MRNVSFQKAVYQPNLGIKKSCGFMLILPGKNRDLIMADLVKKGPCIIIGYTHGTGGFQLIWWKFLATIDEANGHISTIQWKSRMAPSRICRPKQIIEAQLRVIEFMSIHVYKIYHQSTSRKFSKLKRTNYLSNSSVYCIHIYPYIYIYMHISSN